jgi:hypothetical protein
MPRCHRGTIPTNVERELWGSSGHHCSNHACRANLLVPLRDRSVSIGEMAHVIAASEAGPRGAPDDARPAETETFENLLLLCPACHKVVDEAPDEFPIDMLRQWKEERARDVHTAAGIPRFTTRAELDPVISELLERNRAVHRAVGPESALALDDPDSPAADTWRRQALSIIVPNNRRIVDLCRANRGLLNEDEREVVAEFEVHAEGFEFNQISGDKDPGVIMFPIAMNQVFRSHDA